MREHKKYQILGEIWTSNKKTCTNTTVFIKKKYRSATGKLARAPPSGERGRDIARSPRAAALLPPAAASDEETAAARPAATTTAAAAAAAGPSTQPQRPPLEVPHAGRIKYFLHEWLRISDDPQILEMVTGYKLRFYKDPVQLYEPTNPPYSKPDMLTSIQNLLHLGAIVPCNDCEGQFISPIFLIPKSNGTSRFILNLKALNKFIIQEHFKM